MKKKKKKKAGQPPEQKRNTKQKELGNRRIFKERMAHPEGLEPSTARFVAEYSIQLS